MKSFLKRHWVVILVVFLVVLLFGMNYQKEETHKYIGVVINKEFIPPSSSITIIRNTIHTETLPEEYNLLVEVTFTKTRFWKTESETQVGTKRPSYNQGNRQKRHFGTDSGRKVHFDRAVYWNLIVCKTFKEDLSGTA